MSQEAGASLSKVEGGGYSVNQRCHFSALSFEAVLQSHSKTVVLKARHFRERERVFLTLPKLELSSHIKKKKNQSSEKLSNHLLNHRGGQNADMTKGKFPPHGKRKSYFVTWGKK